MKPNRHINLKCGTRQSSDLQDSVLDKLGLLNQISLCIFLFLAWQDYNLLRLVVHAVLFDYVHNSLLPTLLTLFMSCI